MNIKILLITFLHVYQYTNVTSYLYELIIYLDHKTTIGFTFKILKNDTNFKI